MKLWAKLIEKGRYDDLDNPPQIPLITGSPASAKKKRDNISTALLDAATVVACKSISDFTHHLLL